MTSTQEALHTVSGDLTTEHFHISYQIRVEEGTALIIKHAENGKPLGKIIVTIGEEFSISSHRGGARFKITKDGDLKCINEMTRHHFEPASSP